MPKISVIIPVYKVEEYLKRCVDSVIGQTLRDIEIILVDDGSPDNCPAICDEYAKKDDRVRVIHKKNGGLSDARNAGIDIATGDFLGFVDSDDYIEADMYEYLYDLVKKENAEISMCEFFHCYQGKEPEKNEKITVETVNSETAIYYVLESKKASLTVANKIYRREIFGSDLRFPVGKIQEDAFVIVDVLDRAKRVVISNEQKYYYFHRADSITTVRFNERDFDPIEAFDYDYKRCCEINREYLEPVARMRCCWVRFFVLDKMALAGVKNTEQRSKIIKYLKANKSFILKNDVLTMGRKLSFISLYFGFGIYRALVKQNVKRNKKRYE